MLLKSTSSRGVRYLRGIELALLLDDMIGKKLKMTVMLDLSHFDSISPDEDLKVRGIRLPRAERDSGRYALADLPACLCQHF